MIESANVVMQQSDSENDSDSNISNNDINESSQGNPAWADCLANVLNSDKPKSKKSLILSRAKKLNQINTDINDKTSYDFEIAGEIKEEKPNKSEIDKKLLTIKKEKYENKLKALGLRIKPSLKDREREKALKKIATKGVVQLFNAVRMQQKELDSELAKAGPLDHRKDAVLNNIDKRKFLDVLMGGKRAKSEFVDNPIKIEIKSDENNDDSSNYKSEWSVLRDDFMTNKKLKHWDEEESENSESEEENSSESSE